MKKKIIIIIVAIVLFIGLTIGGLLIYKNIKSPNNIPEEEGTNISLDSEEYIIFDDLIYSLIGNNGTVSDIKIIDFGPKEKYSLEALTEDEIFNASVRGVYRKAQIIPYEDEEYDANTSEYADDLVYEMSVDEIKNYAKNVYGKELKELPEEFFYENHLYRLSTDLYFGRAISNIENLYEHEYTISEIMVKDNNYKITAELFNTAIENEVSNDECKQEDGEIVPCEKEEVQSMTFVFNYQKVGENYTFVSIERTI